MKEKFHESGHLYKALGTENLKQRFVSPVWKSSLREQFLLQRYYSDSKELIW